jgi:hypothetical protein
MPPEFVVPEKRIYKLLFDANESVNGKVDVLYEI